MSHTDNTDPYWVQIRYSGIIQHNHERGYCVVDDDRRNRWTWRRHDCTKWETIEFSCTKDDPYRSSRYSRYGWGHRPTCWTTVCDCKIPERWKREDPHHGDCITKRVQCIGHTKRVKHDDWHCTWCDDEIAPTCFPVESDELRFSMFGGGGVPHEYVRQIWNGPERRREREDLREAALLYNSGDDLEDFDFDNRQHHHCARYYYH